jgi:feruloyl esterase
VEITKATLIAAETTEPNPYGPGHSAPLPAYCRVEGVINRRIGVGGEEFGINFALAMPDDWNSDFLMQGGGGGNGVVLLSFAKMLSSLNAFEISNIQKQETE